MLTYGDLADAGFCTMNPHWLKDEYLPFATHEIQVEGLEPFVCCKQCAEAYQELDPERIRVRDLRRGEA